MPKRASTSTVIVVNPDGTVGAVFTGDVVARTFYAPSQTATPRVEIDAAGFRAILADGSTGVNLGASASFTGDVVAHTIHAPSATATPRVDIDAAGFRVILADGSTAVNLGASALFKGDVFAHALYAPNDTAEPRLEVDVNGLRAILAGGAVGARIVANTPRPVFETGLIFSTFDPIFAGTVGVDGAGNWTITSGGDQLYVVEVKVPVGTTLQGFATATILAKAGAGATTAVLQTEIINLSTSAVIGKAGPAILVPLGATATVSDGAELVAPFKIDNTGGGSDLDVGLGTRAVGPGTATQRTGFVVGHYG